MKKRVLALVLCVAMVASVLAGCKSEESSDSGVQEITWMFWDDLNATEDLISKGYKETIDRFNKDYEGKYHVQLLPQTLKSIILSLTHLLQLTTFRTALS